VDATNTLVKRARADMSLPGAPDRPWCSDRYPR
jgi:hypothetical protein